MTVARSKKCTAREPLLLKTKAPACVEAQAGVNVWSAQKLSQIGLHGNSEPGQIVESLGQIGTLGRGHQGHRK